MTATISTAFIATFDAEVKQAYQGAAKLFGTIRTKTGVNGSTHRFPKLGKGLAQPRIPQTDVVPMNVQHSNVTATLEDWSAPEYSDIYDLQKINFDERKELKMAIASAMGRRMDQLTLDAADAGASATQVGTAVGAGVGLNTAKLRRAKRLMDAAGVPATDRTFVHSAVGLEQLLGETDATSSDFNSIKALVNGELNTWLGFKFIMIEDRDEGGLDITGANVRKNFAYHKAALGIAVGMDMRTEMNYVPEKTSWLINGMFSAGAVGIDSSGIIEVLSDET